MKVLISGAGQLALELKDTVPADWELISLDRTQLDISNTSQVNQCLRDVKPDAVINAAAYTVVDRAEEDYQAAYMANVVGPKNLAHICSLLNTHLIHISTDFVFDGQTHRPYKTNHPTKPTNIYGSTKAEGEQAIIDTMKNNWTIIRTAWVYSCRGHNFVKTMLHLMAEKPVLNIVSDQIGTPTWAKGLAIVCWAATRAKLQGIYHWTDAGVASWYDFAVAIQKLATAKKILHSPITINPIGTEDYPTVATRPAYSVLDKSKVLSAIPELKFIHWQDQLNAMLEEFIRDWL